MGQAVTVNRARSSRDTWLTPPLLVKALGPFDLDPCCPPTMPWRTAKRMIKQPKDGLAAKWAGRVWCNPPFSDILPWVAKMAVHGNGIMLLPAKSPETRWGQAALNGMDAVLFLKGRLLFHYEDGSRSTGKWSPYMLLAFGGHNVRTLALLDDEWTGVLLTRP